MEVSAWSSGSGTFGIRVGTPNREQYFNRSWTEIKVEIDGDTHRFSLTSGFWNKCPEFRDTGSEVIQEWLQRHYTIKWPKGYPPRFQLLSLGAARFRLVP